jgi:hypothetical protein
MKHQPLPALPLNMRRLARDARGLPIPAMVQYDASGKPQFAVIDMEKWAALARGRCCGICGRPMHVQIGYWFVGGPQSIANRMFTDLPMHRECAVFSLKVCPFLAMPRYRYIMRDVTLPDGTLVNVNEEASTRRPDCFGLARTSDYRAQILVSEDQPGGTPLLHAAPFERCEWWRNGARIDQPEPEIQPCP